MARKPPPLLQTLSLRGLEPAPPQVWGSVRLVPLLRRDARGDLRLRKRTYGDLATVVSLDGELGAPGIKYISYVPHALVVSWSDDGSPVAAFGSQLEEERDGKQLGKGPLTVRLAHRMVRREDGNRLRMLPLHLAMEGFLAHHFNGPEIAWTEYSRRALSRGLDPRWEESLSGRGLSGLGEALRIFEIHEHQVGVLVFVANSLASVFVLPNPEDYRALHRTLLEDFYGPDLLWYARQPMPPDTVPTLDAGKVDSLAELRAGLAKLRASWADLHELMTSELDGRRVQAQRVYRAGPFQLQRFATSLNPSEENHLGEAIVREDGTLEYLKTYRLSAAQTRRAFLLSALADHHWNLEATAAKLGDSREELVLRMEKAGFGYLLQESVLQAARRRR